MKVRNLPEKDEEGNIVKSDTQKGVELLAGKKVKVTSKVLINTVGFKNGLLDCNHLIKRLCVVMILLFDVFNFCRFIKGKRRI